ncbi:selenoprotein [Bacillus solimangrovi]|uniref:Selenoprotein n=1 Tax=Bacillus solimangrovi TaxID=1305675 RepID=A0A1E5LEH9_9BACI|nr:selenoprotein [Bacillus solimangrovi]
MFNHFRSKVSNVELIPSSGGAFEITVNSVKIFSKLEEGTFPDFEKMIEVMEQMNK